MSKFEAATKSENYKGLAKLIPGDIEAFNPDITKIASDMDKWWNTGKRPSRENTVRLIENTLKYSAAVGIANAVVPPLGSIMVGANAAYSIYNRFDKRRFALKASGHTYRAAAYDLALAAPGLVFKGAFSGLNFIGNQILGNNKRINDLAKQNIGGAGGEIIKNVEKVIGFFDKTSHLLDPAISPQLQASRKDDSGDKKKAA